MDATTVEVQEIPDVTERDFTVAGDDTARALIKQEETAADLELSPLRLRVSTTTLNRARKFVTSAKMRSLNDPCNSAAYVELTAPDPFTLRMTITDCLPDEDVEIGQLRYDADMQMMASQLPKDLQVRVQRRPFFDLIQTFPAGEILEIIEGVDALLIYGTFGAYRIPTETRDKDGSYRWTYDPFADDEQVGFIDLSAAKRELQFVQSNLATDALRPAMLCGVVDEVDGRQVLVGTNGHTLARTTLHGRLPHGLKLPKAAFRSGRAFHGEAITLWSSEIDGRTRYTMQSGTERFSWSDAEEEFVNWKSVIPKDLDGVMTVHDVPAFREVLDRVRVVASSFTGQVEFRATHDAAPTLRAADVESGKAGIESLPFVTLKGPAFRCGWKGEYIDRLLSYMASPPVTLRYQAPGSDGTIKRAFIVEDRTDRMGLLMPVLLDG